MITPYIIILASAITLHTYIITFLFLVIHLTRVNNNFTFPGDSIFSVILATFWEANRTGVKV